MIRPGRERLLGTVEVDESYLGGVEVGVRGRQTETKALIVVAAEKDGKGIGSIRLRHIPDASASSLLPFVQDSIAPGSTVHTDGRLGYLPLEATASRPE
jgi:transposase-like protein